MLINFLARTLRCTETETHENMKKTLKVLGCFSKIVKKNNTALTAQSVQKQKVNIYLIFNGKHLFDF